MHQRQSFVILRVSKHLTIYPNSADTLVKPWGSWKKEHLFYNKAELYIGLIKEAVITNMKDSDCPIAFWGYCMEIRARINNMTKKTNCMDTTRILNWMDMKVTFPIYVGLINMIGFRFMTVINYFIWMKRSLVECLVLREGKSTK